MEKMWSELLKDKDGSFNARELTVLLSLGAFITSWIAQQFFGKPIPEWMFYGDVSLIMGGVFGYSMEKRSKILDAPTADQTPGSTNQ